MSQDSTADSDVIIIGAGLSGLSAAYYLKKTWPEAKFLVLEARPRIGGRTFTVEMNVSGGRKSMFDLGGQWVGSLQSDLLELMKELGMSDLLYPQYLAGSKISWTEPGHVVKQNNELTFCNALICLESSIFFRRVDGITAQLDIDNPYIKNPALVDYLDSTTMESFIRQNVYCAQLRQLIRIGIRTSFGLETSQISALYAVLCGKASGGMENIFLATKNGVRKMRVSGGTHQLSERLVESVEDRNIILNAPVTEIVQEEDFVKVIVSFNKGSTLAHFKAKKVIAAIPPQQLLNIAMTPVIPAFRTEALRALPMANLFKFVVTYEKAFWRAKELSGETICYGGDVGSENMPECPFVGPVSLTYDASLPDGTPALVGFSAGHQAVYWSDCSQEKRKTAILKVLSKMLGDEALNPIDYQEKNWASEEWSGGCPVACLRPGFGRYFTSNLRLPVRHVHIAGTESAQRSIGYMSGAVQAGRRAAVEVLFALGKISPTEAALYGPTTSSQFPSDVHVIPFQSSSLGYKAVVFVGLTCLFYRQLSNLFSFSLSSKLENFLGKK